MYQLLIVDDHPDQVESLAQTIPINELGIEEVYKAYSGIEALDIIRAQSIDIIITDIRMPGMSGIELLKEVKEYPNKSKCIVLSGYSDFEYARQAMQYQTTHYLTKPVDFDELTQILQQIIVELKNEWNEISSYQRAMDTLQENLPLLRREFLNKLLNGYSISENLLNKKMTMLDIPFGSGDPFFLMIIRTHEDIINYNNPDLALLEFTITNLADEMFSKHFDICQCKDIYDYLVFIIKDKHHKERRPLENSLNDDDTATIKLVEKMAANLQRDVSVFMKRHISVCIVNQLGVFPQELEQFYQLGISGIRQQIGSESKYFTVEGGIEKTIKGSLKGPYQPPLLNHLLETGRWEQVSEKLEAIFKELEEKYPHSQEYLQQSFFIIASSFHYISHKSGRQLGDIIRDLNKWIIEGPSFQTVSQLKEWTFEVFGLIKMEIYEDTKETRMSVVDRVHKFVDENISNGLSLQIIADHVNLHPVYLSKVYKGVTDMSISDYLLKYRMERAAKLLETSDDKVYEIGLQLGYQTSHYFIKLFKKYFGVTPQEFRDSLINN